MVRPEDLLQGSEDWRYARLGLVTASRVADVIAKTKSGVSASRANYMAQLIAERLSGCPQESYSNPAMAHGVDTEPHARAAYEFHTNATVVEVGFIKHPTIEMAGASPDGLVNDDGLLETKCPTTSTHLDTLLGGSIPAKYITQIMWQLACCGPDREWCDFVSFDPRLPERLRLFVKRVHRDDVMIARLEKDVTEFLTELSDKVCALDAIAAGRSVVKEQLTASLNILAAG